MINTIVESDRLLIKPLSIDELICIKNNKADKLDIPVLPGALSDAVLSAITKKINKMKEIEAEFHNWYTYWLIICKENGKGIGFAGFKGIQSDRCTEVGYGISPDYRKKGLMTEALKVLIDWAYKTRFLKGITAAVKKNNTGSIKVLQNCGFKLAGTSGSEVLYSLKFK